MVSVPTLEFADFLVLLKPEARIEVQRLDGLGSHDSMESGLKNRIASEFERAISIMK